LTNELVVLHCFFFKNPLTLFKTLSCLWPVYEGKLQLVSSEALEISTLALRNVSEETRGFSVEKGANVCHNYSTSISIRWPINCILIIVEANHLTQGPPYSKREESAFD